MSSFYLTVASVNADDEVNTVLADAFGDIETVAYVARKVDFSGATEYRVSLLSVPAIGSTDGASKVLDLTADGEVSALMLKKKITAARKSLAVPAATAE